MRNIVVSVLFALAVFLPASLHAQTTPAPAPKKLMVFGDSLVAGYGLPYGDSFPAQLEQKLKADGHDIQVVNAGVSGDTTSAGLTRLEFALSQEPDYFILVLGGNDMLRQVDRSVTRDNLSRILRAVKARKIPVLMAGMRSYSNFGGGFEKIYKDLARENDVLLYPFFLEGVALDAQYNLDDGIHPNKRGIGRIVDSIYPDVKKLLKLKKG